jgi:hypothetical protein
MQTYRLGQLAPPDKYSRSAIRGDAVADLERDVNEFGVENPTHDSVVTHSIPPVAAQFADESLAAHARIV